MTLADFDEKCIDFIDDIELVAPYHAKFMSVEVAYFISDFKYMRVFSLAFLSYTIDSCYQVYG